MEGTRNEPAAIVGAEATVEPERRWLIESQAVDARLIVERAARARRVFDQVESAYISVAILGSIAFLYASTTPWVFAIPDFESRLAGVWESFRWDPAQPLDPIANVLVFIPIGFLWSAAWSASPTKRRWHPIETATAAIGCLVLAIVAEVLQFWIPLRDPSIRDILALECGAILGCSLWLAAGHWVTTVLCQLLDRSRLLHPRLDRLRRSVLFGSAYFACLLIVVYASPVRLFWTYRNWSISLQHLPISRPDLSSPQRHGLLTELLSGAVVALLVVSACYIGQSTVRFFKRHDPGQ
jgi:VanZ family protein